MLKIAKFYKFLIYYIFIVICVLYPKIFKIKARDGIQRYKRIN
jgi:hypothetical protein